VLGGSFRSGRTAPTDPAAEAAPAVRLREAFATSLAPFPSYDLTYVLVGIVLLAALLVWAWSSRRGHTARVAPVAAAVVAVIYFYRLSFGLGFWPGLVATTPLAAVALALGWRASADRLVLAYALVPLPLVFVFQFPGGALPQWAGRYILTSGFLLATLGAASLPALVPWARRGFVVASVFTAAVGVAWLSVRTHQVAASAALLNARPEAVLVSRDGFPPREFAASYGTKNWLATVDDADLDTVVQVLNGSGAPSFALVDLDPARPAPDVPGFHVVSRSTVPFIDPSTFTVTSYARDPA
jgi:hypothetical protein